MTVSLVIAAGGTGGHLMPALAVADAVITRDPGAHIAFVGTGRSVERDILASAGFRSHETAVRPLTRDARGITAPFALLRAIAQARRALRAERANVVLGMGGYPSVPVLVAARMRRIPSLLHEQNAVVGLANELAARATPNIAVSFPEAIAAFRGRRARLTGVPLRPSIAAFDREALRAEALEHLQLSPGRRTLLVIGGSLGAARLNAAVVFMAERWRGRDDLQIVVLAGSENSAALAAHFPDGGVMVRCLPFLQRMELGYAAADIALCRAGASTVAELAATGTPSVLVPLPVARRKEQHANARALTVVGAAITVDDGDATGDRLSPMIEEVLGDDARLARMSAAARTVARPHAAEAIAEWLLDLA